MKKILLILILLPLLMFGQKDVLIHLTTDNYPSETRWVLHADSINGTILGQVNYGHYDSSSISYIDTVSIPDSITNISWVIYDSYGDGIPGGSYYVSICNDTIVNYPNPTFTTGLIHNRLVPQCAANPPPCVPATVIINLDQYQGETSWDIKDTNGIIYAESVTYAGNPDYATIIAPVCIPKGELIFTIYDSYGDGLNGALWQGQDGSYYLKQCNDTLVYGTDPAFGMDSLHTFASDSCPPILGCTDNNYVEYNHLADVDDGSCLTLKVYGCLDTTMYNYNSSANTMDMVGNCDFTLTLHDLIGNGWVGSELKLFGPDSIYTFTHTGGFTDVYQIDITAPSPITFKFFISAQASLTTIECGFTLVNPEGDTIIDIQPPFIQPLLPYNLLTNCGNTCIEKIFGCTDLVAVNYDSLANTDNASCYYTPGCMNSSYLEYYTQGFTADYNNGTCLTVAVWGCTDSIAFNYNSLSNIDNGGCIDVITGCMQPLAFNYNPNANTSDTCIAIVYGCMSNLALNYNPLANTDDNSCIGIVEGCTDTLMWNYSPSANVDNGSCLPYIYGCTDATMWNYNAQANTDNGSCLEYAYGCIDTTAFNYDPLANTDNGTCTPFIYGCTNPIALNYDALANTDDFSCVLPIYGCMDSLAFNYNPLANVDNNSCLPVILGCTDPIALNYCDSCNTDDFSCILPIYGCTDSIMFNFNPLANVDNNTCIPFTYGCTDPSALNYNASANTEDFSCIPYIYGCMDSTALNYDSTANTDNGSCVVVVEGCMDPNAYNYNELVNVSDSASCLYDSGCITGPGNPYWLNDPCYTWVISVDDYCCENEWDTICQLTYDHCEGTWTQPIPKRITEKKLLMITDLLGRPVNDIKNELLFYIYDDGSVKRKIIINNK